MAIYKGSRYEYSLIDYLYTPKFDMSTPIVFYTIASLGKLSYTEHQYVPGERLDQLATTYYNNPKLWWLIVEANPEVVDFIHLTQGTVLRIPNV